jgi:hypothetical protein
VCRAAFALVDVADLVKGAVSEINAVIADRKPAVGMVNDGYPLADCRLGDWCERLAIVRRM